LDTLGIREVSEALESIWRWVVLAAAAAGVGSGALAWAGRVSPETQSRLGFIYLLALGVGVALGIIDWILHLLGSVNTGVFYTVVHPIVMLAGFAVAYFTYVRASRAQALARARTATIGYLASIVLVVSAIPGVLFKGGILEGLF
jgi:hypothetical protein